MARPSPRSHIYENGDTSAEMRAASWRPCASIDVTSGRRARLRRLQQHVLQVAEQWHGAGTQPFVPGGLRFIYEASEQFKIEPVTGYELHCRSKWMTSQLGSCLLVSYSR